MSIAIPTDSVLRNLNYVLDNPAQLRAPERLMLYALTVAYKPRFALEIGSAEGGSTLLTCGAMDDNGFGQLVCVDPAFRFSDELWARVQHRVTRIAGYSPQALPQAAAAIAPERFDFAFIDGDHTRSGVTRDIEGVLDLLADHALLLFHDSHHPPVREGIDEMVERRADELFDLGELSAEETRLETAEGVEIWAGLRAARFVRRGAAPRDNALRGNGDTQLAQLQRAQAVLAAECRERGRRIGQLETDNKRLVDKLAQVGVEFESVADWESQLRAELAEIESSRAWKLVGRVKRTAAYRVLARIRWGPGWDVPPPEETLAQRLERIKTSKSFRLIQSVKRTPIYGWYARRAQRSDSRRAGP